MERPAAHNISPGNRMMIGTRIGNYEIVAEIGRGGMGVVYEAFDARLNRRVAIKAIRPDGRADAEARRRLLREAQSASALGHPYICRIFDVIETAAETFVVMERLTGESLADRIGRGPLPVRDAVRVALEIAEALGEAHRLGIIHRDIKPSNVMITESGHAKVMDFGLALPFGAASSDTSSGTASEATLAGRVVGSPGYMSPEQAIGESLDARSDIFALGIVLYEMLSGRNPFAGPTIPAQVLALFSHDPEPLSPQRADIPAGLDEIVRAMLRRDVQERPASLDVVRGTLEILLRDDGRPAGPSSGAAPAIPRPRTRYARSGNVNIAYQVVGDGPVDLVYVPGWVSNVEMAWEYPMMAHFLEQLASKTRLILFDKRGTGLSDRVPESELPGLEDRMDDVRAVMDAVGSGRAVLFGASEAGSLCMLFAATYPERTVALITFGVFAKRVWSPDYPWAPTPQERARWLEQVESTWGSQVDLDVLSPTLARDPDFVRWWSAYQRQSASPSAAAALGRMNTQIDVTHVLPAIRVPTLIMHRTGDRDAKVDEGRYIAARIPGARFVELPGDDHLSFIDADPILAEVETFLAEVRLDEVRRNEETKRGAAPDLEWVLATLLVVIPEAGEKDSPEMIRLSEAAREVIRKYRGRDIPAVPSHATAVKSPDAAAPPIQASFDGPARAIRCAAEIRDLYSQKSVSCRAGVHVGVCSTQECSPRSPALSMAQDIAAGAGSGQILASGIVTDLVAGSGIEFGI